MPDSAIIVLVDAGRLKSARAMDMPAVAAKYSSSSSTMSIVTLGAGGAVVLPGQVISSVGAIYWPNELGPTDGTENAEVLNAAYELIQSTGVAALAVLPLIDWADFPSLYGELQQINGVRVLDHPLTIGSPAKPKHTTTPMASSAQNQPLPTIDLAARPIPPKTATGRAGAQPKTPGSRGSKPTYLPMRPNPNSAAGRAAARAAVVAGAPPAPPPAVVGPVVASRIKSPSPGAAPSMTPGNTKSTAAKPSARAKKPAKSSRKKIVAGVVVVLMTGAIVGWWSGTAFTVAGTAQVAGVGDCWNASRYELAKSGKESVPATVACTSDEAHLQVVDDAAECGADCTVVTVASTPVRVRTIPRSGDCLFAFINTMFPTGTSQASGWLSELTPCAISVEPESWMSRDIDNVATALGVDQSALVLTRVEIATVSQTEVACPEGQISWEWDFTAPSLWLCTSEASTP